MRGQRDDDPLAAGDQGREVGAGLAEAGGALDQERRIASLNVLLDQACKVRLLNRPVLHD